MKPLRVLALNNGLNRSCGVSHTILTLAENLAGRVRFFVGAPPGGSLFEEMEARGATVLPLPVDSERKSLPAFAEAVSRISRLCREERIDLIHSNHRWTSFIARFPATALGVPLLGTAHSMHIGGLRPLSFIEDRIIAVSEALRRFLMEEFAVPGEKIVVIRNGIDLSDRPDRRRLAAMEQLIAPPTGKVRDLPVIGAVGRLGVEKGYRFLVEAAAALRGRARFVVAGDGPEEASLKSLAAGLGLGPEEFSFIGPIRDVPAFLHRIDILALPSLSEGLPLVLLEAGAAGRPVAASRVGGVPEVVEEGRSGRLVPPGDSPALARVLGEMLSDPEGSRALGQALRRKVRADFDARVQTDRVYQIYLELARGGFRKLK